MSENEASARWMSVAVAAAVVGYDAISLRRAIARHARKNADGAIEASFDGIVARKLGNTWRVWLSPAWRKPAA